MFVDTQVRPQGEQVDADAPSKLRSLFLRAADIMDIHGLCKGMRSDAQERVCIAGALAWASTGNPYQADPWANSAYEYATRFLKIGAANWNDHPERTKDEVVEKLREIAQGL